MYELLIFRWYVTGLSGILILGGLLRLLLDKYRIFREGVNGAVRAVVRRWMIDQAFLFVFAYFIFRSSWKALAIFNAATTYTPDQIGALRGQTIGQVIMLVWQIARWWSYRDALAAAHDIEREKKRAYEAGQR